MSCSINNEEANIENENLDNLEIATRNEGDPLGEDIYYLIKSDKDTDLEVLSSFTKPIEFNDYSILFSGMSILDDGDIIFNLKINYPYDGFVKKNASYLCRYDGKDLGMTTSVEDEEAYQPLTLSPNPATDYIKLSSTVQNKIYNVSVIDILGKTRPIKFDDSWELDISTLLPGSYFLRYQQDGKLITLPFIKI